MKEDLKRYILNHYSVLLSKEEKLALKHLRHAQKLASQSNTEKVKTIKAYLKIGWISENEIDLTDESVQRIENDLAESLLKNHYDQISINNCPKCNQLARTPFAKQCRYCGHSWH